jgi:hypothetical protein
VTREQARDLVELLRANYATFHVPDATVNLWLAELEPLEYELAERFVLQTIRSSRFWPEIAKWRVPYDEVMAVRRKQAKEEERQRNVLPAAAEVPPEERKRMAAQMRADVAKLTAKIGRPMVPDRNGHDPDADIPL